MNYGADGHVDPLVEDRAEIVGLEVGSRLSTASLNYLTPDLAGRGGPILALLSAAMRTGSQGPVSSSTETRYALSAKRRTQSSSRRPAGFSIGAVWTMHPIAGANGVCAPRLVSPRMAKQGLPRPPRWCISTSFLEGPGRIGLPLPAPARIVPTHVNLTTHCYFQPGRAAAVRNLADHELQISARPGDPGRWGPALGLTGPANRGLPGRGLDLPKYVACSAHTLGAQPDPQIANRRGAGKTTAMAP